MYQGDIYADSNESASNNMLLIVKVQQLLDFIVLPNTHASKVIEKWIKTNQ